MKMLYLEDRDHQIMAGILVIEPDGQREHDYYFAYPALPLFERYRTRRLEPAWVNPGTTFTDAGLLTWLATIAADCPASSACARFSIAGATAGSFTFSLYLPFEFCAPGTTAPAHRCDLTATMNAADLALATGIEAARVREVLAGPDHLRAEDGGSP